MEYRFGCGEWELVPDTIGDDVLENVAQKLARYEFESSPHLEDESKWPIDVSIRDEENVYDFEVDMSTAPVFLAIKIGDGDE